MKTCSRCGERRPLGEFTRDRQTPDGLNRRCRDCKTEMGRVYSRANPHKRREISQRQYAQDAGKRQAEWRKANPERWAEIRLAFKERNPNARREQSQRRRARLMAATIGVVDLEALWTANEGLCQMCREPIDRTLKAPHPMSASVDHIVPLARGGTHEQSNLQWTHLVENMQKGAKTVPDPASTLLKEWSPLQS